MVAKLVSTGSFLPQNAIGNEALTQFPPSRIPTIAEKTGVCSRRHAADSQCTSDLALEAARCCLEKAGVEPDALDAILLATSSPDRIQPATATRVQALLGARRAFAFDINSVCTGALYAVKIADALIRSGSANCVLVIGAEKYSSFLNPRDFSTFPYFGDGAGALLLAADRGGAVVAQTILRSDGAGSEIIQIPAGGTMIPYARMSNPTQAYFTMVGREVFEFAVGKGTEVVRELLEVSNLNADQVSWVVPHQANINIINELSARLHIDRSRFYVNLDRYGNTAAASVPIALDELLGSEQVHPGDRVVLVAFGGGLSWGASLLEF